MKIPIALTRLLAPLALFAAVLPVSNAAAATPGDSVQAVSEALTCQCGCGLTVANCNHPQCEFSVPVRDQIEKMLREGRGRAEIVAMFRQKYGEKILSAPTVEGFDLLAWMMPFAALLAGCGVIFAVVGRWHKDSAASEGHGGADVVSGAIDLELKSRLERDLRERS